MLNKDFILHEIQPFLNEEREISATEFESLFSGLPLQEQYEVINIMIDHNIDYVDEKKETSRGPKSPGVTVAVSHSTGNRREDGYWKMLNLTNEQLCVLAHRGDDRAKAALLRKNEGAVRDIAIKRMKGFSRTNLTMDDLVQEGYIGILKAIERYDPDQGTKFITYCEYWIHQQIFRSAIETGYLIRLPTHFYERLVKVSRCRRLHPNADAKELAALLADDGITIEQVQKAIAWSELYLNTASLNAPIGEENAMELQDIIPDEDMESVEDTIVAAMLQEKMDEVLSTLTPKEAKVLRLRFGFDDGRTRTLEEVGSFFNVTRERIRQIEMKALRKLRHPSRSKKLREFLQ